MLIQILFSKVNLGILKGTVSEPCVLKINDKTLELSDNLNFEVELNVYDGMPIIVWARDIAGNQTTLLFKAIIDNTPPVITFINPANNSKDEIIKFQTTSDTFEIKFSVNEKSKVYVNSLEINANENIFTYLTPLSNGENSFVIKAIDVAGNETQRTLVILKQDEKILKLVVGSQEAQIGSEVFTLEAPPFVEKALPLFLYVLFQKHLEHKSNGTMP